MYLAHLLDSLTVCQLNSFSWIFNYFSLHSFTETKYNNIEPDYHTSNTLEHKRTLSVYISRVHNAFIYQTSSNAVIDALVYKYNTYIKITLGEFVETMSDVSIYFYRS